MAIAHPFHQRPSAGPRRLGTAMAEADIADMRLLRLLRLDGRGFARGLRRLARLMASKGDTGRFDWSDAAVVASPHGPTAPAPRRSGAIARDYYRAAYTRQQNNEGKSGMSTPIHSDPYSAFLSREAAQPRRRRLR